MRKRKVTYPVARTATKQPRTAGLPGDPTYVRSTVATINLAALEVRDDLKIGHRVRIGGEGLYSGEFAVVQSLSSGIIPAAIVKTEAGKTRRVRTVDLERVAADNYPWLSDDPAVGVGSGSGLGSGSGSGSGSDASLTVSADGTGAGAPSGNRGARILTGKAASSAAQTRTNAVR